MDPDQEPHQQLLSQKEVLYGHPGKAGGQKRLGIDQSGTIKSIQKKRNIFIHGFERKKTEKI